MEPGPDSGNIFWPTWARCWKAKRCGKWPVASASGHAASANCAPKRCYQILTHNDRADLKPGQYLLESPKPQPAFAREISKETRAFVLDRNGFTCQMCGAVAGEAHPYDPTRQTRLHIGHVIDKSMGGSDEPANLRAICSVCNEGASNVMLPRPDLQRLLVQVRRATAADQRALLAWLQTKFKA